MEVLKTNLCKDQNAIQTSLVQAEKYAAQLVILGTGGAEGRKGGGRGEKLRQHLPSTTRARFYTEISQPPSSRPARLQPTFQKIKSTHKQETADTGSAKPRDLSIRSKKKNTPSFGTSSFPEKVTRVRDRFGREGAAAQSRTRAASAQHLLRPNKETSVRARLGS